MAKKPAEAPTAQEAQPSGIKVEQAAALIRVSVRRIQQLMQEGWIKRTPGGVLTGVAVVHGYLDFQEDATKRLMAKFADNEVRRAKAKEINIRIAEKERELVPRDEAEGFVQLLIGGVVSLLQGLPARFTRDVNERKRLEHLVSDVRAEVAGLAAKFGAAFRTGEEFIDPAGEDDAGPVG
jgi:hypothetical protein